MDNPHFLFWKVTVTFQIVKWKLSRLES